MKRESVEARKQGCEEARKQGSRKARKRGSEEVRKRGSKEARKQGSEEAMKQGSEEAKKQVRNVQMNEPTDGRTKERKKDQKKILVLVYSYTNPRFARQKS